MSARPSLDDALDAAIDAVRSGAPLDGVLAAWPEHSAQLRVLLTPLATSTPPVAPPFDSARMNAGYWRVRAAVLAAREPARPWWRRPVSFASLSVPAGIVALAAIGVAGAAAGGAAAVTGHGVPAAVEQIVTLGQKGGEAGNGNGHAIGNGGPNGNAQPGAGTTAAAGSEPTLATGQPAQMTASGGISDAHGNVFTLTATDGTVWKVNIDGQTVVTGTIEDGATATVTGDATSTTDKNLHADQVDVTAAAATPAADSTSTPEGAETPGQGPDHTPGVPQGTPRSGNDNGNNGASATAPAGNGPGGTGPPGPAKTVTTGNGNGGGTGRKP